MESEHRFIPLSRRFRGFLPVVVDVETGGFNSATDALLEIAVCIPKLDENGYLVRGETHSAHVKPFPGANLERASLEVNGIKVDNPLRLALDEAEALGKVLKRELMAQGVSAGDGELWTREERGTAYA